MKRIIYLIFFIIHPYINANERITKNTTIVTGIIQNPKDEYVKIDKHESKLDTNNFFRFKFNLEYVKYFSLKHDQSITICLNPGDSIYITFDASQLYETIQFTGTGAKKNNYLISSYLLRDKLFNHEEIYSSPEEVFINRIKSIKDSLTNLFNSFLNISKDIHHEFIEIENNRLLYNWASVRVKYLRFHRKYTKDYSFIVSDAYFNFISDLDLNDSCLFKHAFYRGFLKDYLYDRIIPIIEIDNEYKNKDNIVKYAKLKFAIQTFTNEKIKNEMIFEIMKNQIFTMGIHGMDDMLNLFYENCTNPQYISEIKKFYDKEKENRGKSIIREYKKIHNITLEAHIFQPPDSLSDSRLPAIIIFHGGGWDFGKPEWAFGLCRKFVSLDMVAISAQYRLCSRHQTTPIESIMDAKSVIRWVRQHADEFKIDTNKIIASGWSTGGHIAACTGIINKFDEQNEDLSKSSIPNAMLFWFSPLYLSKETDKDNWFEFLLKGRAEIEDCSPAHNIHSNIPPTIIFHGTEDNTVPYWSVVEFNKRMNEANNTCELHTLQGQGHLFEINQTLEVTKQFLNRINVLENEIK